MVVSAVSRVNAQVVMPSALVVTVALPSTVVPFSSTCSTSPLASGAATVPESVGVPSLVMPPLAIVPRYRPTLSLMVVIATVLVGATVSMLKTRAAEIGPRLPAPSTTRAVIDTMPSASGVVGVKLQLVVVGAGRTSPIQVPLA